MRYTYDYTMPAGITTPKDSIEAASNCALFLQINGLGIWDKWHGKIRAKDQRLLFGKSFGRLSITINGLDETIETSRTCCFGRDWTEVHLVDLTANTVKDRSSGYLNDFIVTIN